MAEMQTIPLTFGHGRAVQVQRDAGTGAELAVILPGLRYTCDRPLLRDVAQVFQSRGCDIARVTFTYDDDPQFMKAEDGLQFDQLAADGRDIIDALLSRQPYDRVWIIGKSLGTLSMGGVLSEGHYSPQQVHAIWLTPGLIETPLLDQLLAQPYPSLAILGTEDSSCRADIVDRLSASAHIAFHSISGADHAFGHADGPKASQDAVDQATRIVADWVTAHDAG
ncbi:alpha/beta family hydrolase [Gymnodinialimonas sp. 2305UL16-5]|uniref:alpha/beta family hydrolase n=1 Tax=Gymnodinialimonas mytili TaxID=3126503 RepID=UPI0030B175EC